MADTDTFHFKDDFFEEILNGVPKEDVSESQKESSVVTLSPNSKTRVKYVAKAFLSSEESRRVFSSAIIKAKQKENKALIDKFSIVLFKEKVEDSKDKDEEEEAIEEVAEEKSSGPLSKIIALKAKFEKLKRLGKKGRNILNHINSIKAYFLMIGSMSFASAISNRNKIIRTLNDNFDGFLDDTIYPFLNNGIIPTLTSTMFNLFGKIRKFSDDMLDRYYALLEGALEILFEINLKVLQAGISILPGGAGAALAMEECWRAYKITKMLQRRAKGYEMLFHAGIEMIKNPEIVMEVLKGGKSTLFAFLGKMDKNAQEKIDQLINLGIKQSQKAGTDIIDSLNKNDGADISKLISNSGSIIGTADDVFGGLKDIVNDKIDEFVNVFDKNTPTYKQYKYAYNLISQMYFKGVDYSPWTKMAMNLNNMLIFVNDKFEKTYEKWGQIVNSNTGFVNTENKVLSVDDLKNYFLRFIGDEKNHVYMTIKTPKGKKVLVNDKKKRGSELKKIDKMIISVKTIERISYNKSNFTKMGGQYVPEIKFYLSHLTKNLFLEKSKKYLTLKGDYYERRVSVSKDGNKTYTVKKIDSVTNYHKLMSPSNKKVTLNDESYTQFSNGIPLKFLKSINEKHYSPRGLILNKLFSPFHYKKMNGNDINNSFKSYIKVNKKDIDYLTNNSIYIDKTFDGTNYADERFALYADDYNIYEKGIKDDELITETGLGNVRLFKLKSGFDKGYRDYNLSTPQEIKFEIKMDGTSNITWIDLLSSEVLFENYSTKRFEMMNDNLNKSIIIVEELRDEIKKLRF